MAVMLKRYNIKEIYSDAARRRMLIARSTVVAQAREGIDITLSQALASYDEVTKKDNMEYKPCPFCGSTNTILINGLDHLGEMWVECINCFARGPNAGDSGDAAQYWNKREQPPKTKEQQ